MTTIHFDAKLDDAQRRARMYAGELFVYSPGFYSESLCEFARVMCEEAFHPHHPTEAAQHLTVEQYASVLAELKPQFIHHPECKRYVVRMLTELGCDPHETYYDVPRLNASNATDSVSKCEAAGQPPRRDIWYAAPPCQINWWLPVYPLDYDNELAFHLDYWNQPVENTSAEFDQQQWLASGRGQSDNCDGNACPHPRVLRPLAGNNDTRLVCRAGGMIGFSAAHLHSTRPNAGLRNQLSIEFRTVNRSALESGCGAPNVDCRCTGTTLNAFLRMDDEAHLPDALVRRYAGCGGQS